MPSFPIITEYFHFFHFLGMFTPHFMLSFVIFCLVLQ